jgi:hypothetical protein
MVIRYRARCLSRWLWPVAATMIVVLSNGSGAQAPEQPARVPKWPNVLVVPSSPLLEVLEDAWDRSPTFRRQCRELANGRAVVTLRWGTVDSQVRAKTVMERLDGVIVARVSVPTGSETMELVAHELQHVIERIGGLDHKAEANRPRSGVWTVGSGHGSYETQAAIDAGRRVASELRDTPDARRAVPK